MAISTTTNRDVPPSLLRGTRALVLGALTIALLGGLFANRGLFWGSILPTASARAVSTYVVQPSELIVTVTEDGNVESANNVDVKCKVAGGSTILWIIKDGTEVKAGDKLVELDASALEDQINTQKIAYNKAMSTVVQAKKNYEVAQLAVREYLEGTYQQSLENAETQITIAEENLRSSQNSLDYSKKMFQRGYISELELESQEFTVRRAELELAQAKTSKKVLEEFTKVKTLVDLESQVETAKSTLESEQAAFEVEQAKLKRLEIQLENCTIVAPQDGMVVYANEQGRFGQQSVTVEEGAAVRDRQTILRLPDLSQMQVKANVHETKVEQLKEGMRARVKIQGREFLGFVKSIANQHEATSFFSGNVKEYATYVRVEGTAAGLRPGMTAEVEILVVHLKDVLSVPVSSVIEQRGEFFAWVLQSDGKMEKRNLKLGKTNDNFVEVVSGLVAGDQVIRNPRSVIADARGAAQESEETDVTKKFGEVADRPQAASGDKTQAEPNGTTSRPAPAEGRGPNETSNARERGGEPPAANRREGGPGGGRRPDVMSFDKDGDGKVSQEEVPEPMRPFFDRIDENADGFIDKPEADKMRERMRQMGAGGPPGEASGP